MWRGPSLCCLLAVAHLYFLVLVHSKETAYVPSTPRINSLTANFSTHTLNLEWDDGGSAVPTDVDVTWEIQVLRKDPMEVVAQELYNSKLIGKRTTVLHWSWTSDLPLECTTHYVQIRCSHHLGGNPEPTSWSGWSLLAKIPGKDTGSYYEIFTMTEVAQVGSNLTFCCVLKTGQELVIIDYDSYLAPQPRIRLSDYSIMIQVPSVNKSIQSGDNAWCMTEPHDVVGVSIFVGYPPDAPQDLTCKTSDFKQITCKWKGGRPTNLSSPLRRTYYTLFESISGKSVPYTGKEKAEYYSCNFPVLDGQRKYHFTVHASNPLGQSEASISIDIKDRGKKRKRNKKKPYF